jgi:L-ascorbate metabolism protein UlaG (beta-lactamase superfamily)
MIKTTLIGHASLLIQSRETTIVTDPVWSDYQWEELQVLCPSIVLERDKIPPVDVLNISHRHQDHFDVRTLAYLAQNDRILKPDATILAPNDEILVDVLKELGFKNIRVVTDFEPMQFKDVTLTPTPSRNQISTSEDYYPEHGLLVNDGEVTVWNEVDTLVDPETIDRIRELYGQIDLAHVRFVPLIEGNFSYHKSTNLPLSEYCTFLNVVKALGPKMVVPGAAFFRYRDEVGFLNQYSFPTTMEQFIRDLAAFCPEVPCRSFLHGDVMYVTTDGVRIEKQSSEFVSIRENDGHRVAFKPVMEVPPIRTRTTDPKQHKREMKVVRDFIENHLMGRILKSDMLGAWLHWQVVYQLEVFGQGDSEVWGIDFAQDKLRLQKGDLGKINIYEGIGSSELYALIEGTTSWDYVTLCGNYRTFNNIYRITDGSFEIPPEDKSNYTLEPLMEAFPWDKVMDREKFMKDVRRWKGKALVGEG